MLIIPSCRGEELGSKIIPIKSYLNTELVFASKTRKFVRGSYDEALNVNEKFT